MELEIKQFITVVRQMAGMAGYELDESCCVIDGRGEVESSSPRTQSRARPDVALQPGGFDSIVTVLNQQYRRPSTCMPRIPRLHLCFTSLMSRSS
jgi:hypothetical protein